MKLERFRLERYFAEHEFSSPYLLCISDCESMELQDLLSLEPDAQERFLTLWPGYTESSCAFTGRIPAIPDPARKQSVNYRKRTSPVPALPQEQSRKHLPIT